MMKLFDGHKDGLLDGFTVSEEYFSNNDCIIRNFDSMNNRTSTVWLLSSKDG